MSTDAHNTLASVELLFTGAVKYDDGEEYYAVDYKTFPPCDMMLDYDTSSDEQGWFATLYDTNTGTSICRTKYYPKEQSSINQVEYLLAFLQSEYHFEEAWARPTVDTPVIDDLSDLKDI